MADSECGNAVKGGSGGGSGGGVVSGGGVTSDELNFVVVAM